MTQVAVEPSDHFYSADGMAFPPTPPPSDDDDDPSFLGFLGVLSLGAQDSKWFQEGKREEI